jgi:hypothetical protein
MSDYFDRFALGEPVSITDESGARNAMGIPFMNCMVVGRRASCSAEIEEIETAYFDSLQLPLPFWDGEAGELEPLSHFDFQLLERAVVTPTEWEILVLEGHFASRKETT